VCEGAISFGHKVTPSVPKCVAYNFGLKSNFINFDRQIEYLAENIWKSTIPNVYNMKVYFMMIFFGIVQVDIFCNIFYQT
jgi:hypothetical protein